MTNNSNPFDLDGNQVRNKERTAGDVARANVIDVLPELHSVRVNPRGNNSPIVVPVITPMYGMQALPQVGARVTLLYITDNVPIVVGGVYLADAQQPPNGEPGDAIYGNGSGSAITAHEDGHISIITGGNERVDIDSQSASVYLNTDYSASSGGTYHTIPFNAVEEDREGLFDTGSNNMQIRAGGLHRLSASVELPSAGQNNQYQLAIFVNGEETKRVSRQSAVNEPLSLQVTTMVRLDADDVIDVRIMNNSGVSRTVRGSKVTTEFNVRRAGI